ncbi:NAD-dependent epimerase/dehydratase family protein [uncultured Rhodoblastus sp.]|uniref:NAD-dependent epimerase/dehydratase family protein n=1 Tax=uncultured Rhodoblastus sp. TaxID=543037 RepID=UPI0025DDB3A9|nr:NAD-dependent epimerase/dehydratase family protein [uncultured Rhodoblastus sp.]
MKVFLSGGTGFIGQATVSAIRRRGWELTALVRDPDSASAQWIYRQGGNLVQGDVTSPSGLAQAMAGIDVAIHNAGVYEIGADAATIERMRQVNVEGTRHFLSASLAAGLPRTVYVSTVWALGPSGRPPAPSVTRDESQVHDGHSLTPYEQSKLDAHHVALDMRRAGLPLSIAMPNAVMGANDHAAFGYLLRLTLLGLMPPVGCGADAIYAPVDVDALAEGLCLVAERAPMGEDYLFCGEPVSLGRLFEIWRQMTGGSAGRFNLPRAVMRPQMALVEPLQRALGLPAFFSRDAVDATLAHLDYSSAKARRDLGWSCPQPEEMWRQIIAREKQLMAERQGVLAKLKHLPVVA